MSHVMLADEPIKALPCTFYPSHWFLVQGMSFEWCNLSSQMHSEALQMSLERSCAAVVLCSCSS